MLIMNGFITMVLYNLAPDNSLKVWSAFSAFEKNNLMQGERVQNQLVAVRVWTES